MACVVAGVCMSFSSDSGALFGRAEHFSGGGESVLGFWCVLQCMMLVGPGLHFAPWPRWSRVLGLLPW